MCFPYCVPFNVIWRRPLSPLFPYTTLFRSVPVDDSRYLGVSQSRRRPGTDDSLHEERRHLGRAAPALRPRARRFQRQPVQLAGPAPAARPGEEERQRAARALTYFFVNTDFGIMQCTPLRTSTTCETRQSPTIETSE